MPSDAKEQTMEATTPLPAQRCLMEFIAAFLRGIFGVLDASDFGAVVSPFLESSQKQWLAWDIERNAKRNPLILMEIVELKRKKDEIEWVLEWKGGLRYKLKVDCVV